MSLSYTPLSSLKTNLLLEVVTLRKSGLSRGLFSLWNCWYFFSFSLLSCMVKNSWIWVRACWFAIGKMSWTHPEQLPGSKSALPLDISFTHLFLLTSSFRNLCHMIGVRFEDAINLSRYLWSLSHGLTHHLPCPIFAHWWRASYCLFLLKTKK